MRISPHQAGVGAPVEIIKPIAIIARLGNLVEVGIVA